MRYSNTALKELSKRYKNILIKCAILNAAALLAFATPAGASSLSCNGTTCTGETGASEYSAVSGYSIYGENGATISFNQESLTASSNDNEAIKVTNNSSLTINVDTLSVRAPDYYGLTATNRSDITVTAKTVNVNGVVFASTNVIDDGKKTNLSITADTINIDGGNGAAVIAFSAGNLTLNGNTTIKTTPESSSAIYARGYSTIDINTKTNATTKILGNITFDYYKENSNSPIDATININLNGSESYWTGNILRDWSKDIEESEKEELLKIENGLSLTLNDGAVWTATAVSSTLPPEQLAVTSLTINKGIINSENGNAYVKTMTVNGDLTLNGTLTTVEGGTITFANGSTLTTKLDDSVKFSGNGKVAGTINLTNLSTGTYSFVEDNVHVDSLSFTNGLYNIDWTDDTKTTINVTEKSNNQVANEVVASTGASQQEASAVLALVAADGSATGKGSLIAAAISEAMQSGNSATAVEAAKQAAPTTSQVVTGVAKEAANTIAKLSTSRLDSIKGTSGGDITQGAGLWMQALYNHTKQDATSNSDGFKANSRGFALGVDKEITDTTIVGVGYGYMYTDADSYGRDLEIDGHNFFIYGKYQPNKWYVSSVLNYNYSKYTEKKSPLAIQLRSEYDVNSYGANLMTGYDLKNGFTPEAGLRYLVVDADSYYDGMQRIHSNRDDVLTAVAGVKYTTTYKAKGIDFKPNVRLAATYDIVSDNSRSNVSVIGGSNYSIEGSRLHRFGVEAGAGVTASIDNIDITLEYNGAFRQDYKSQGGMLKARYNF